MAATSGRPSATNVSTRWAAPQTGKSQGRHRCQGMAAAQAAKASGTRTRASAMSLLERAEPRGVDGGELAADVLDDDAHHEDGDDQIEQDGHLDEDGHGLDQGQAHDEDPVLQREVSHHLRDGLAPRGEQEEAGDRKSTRLNSSHGSISY